MANLRFFGSTVDAIAPQEQNVLSQYRTHNWQVEQANAAAAERAREASIRAWQFGQQNEQQQAQQDYANRVNLLQFAERARGSRVAEGLAAEQVRNVPLEQAYQDAERMAEYATPEILDKFFGATVPRPRLNILKEFARTRTKEVETATAAQKQDVLFDITSKASKGQLPFQLNEVATMFGLPEADVKPAWERGQKMFSDMMIQKLNAATAKAKLNATNNFEKQARKSPDLTPDELEQVKRSVGAIQPTVRYDKETGWSMRPPTEWESEGERIAALRAKNRATPAVDLSQFRTATNAPVVTAPAVIAPRAAVMPAPINPSQRQVGQVYQTPRGPMRWQGRGWSTP